MKKFNVKPNQEAKVVVGIEGGVAFIYGIYVDEDEADEQRIMLAEDMIKKHRRARESMKKIVTPRVRYEFTEEELLSLDDRLRENYKVVSVKLGEPIEVELFEVL